MVFYISSYVVGLSTFVSYPGLDSKEHLQAGKKKAHYSDLGCYGNVAIFEYNCLFEQS